MENSAIFLSRSWKRRIGLTQTLLGFRKMLLELLFDLIIFQAIYLTNELAVGFLIEFGLYTVG